MYFGAKIALLYPKQPPGHGVVEAGQWVWLCPWTHVRIASMSPTCYSKSYTVLSLRHIPGQRAHKDTSH